LLHVICKTPAWKIGPAIAITTSSNFLMDGGVTEGLFVVCGHYCLGPF
jgi:hypothetical protein